MRGDASVESHTRANRCRRVRHAALKNLEPRSGANCGICKWLRRSSWVLERLEIALRMGHQAANKTRFITYPGHVGVAAVRVVRKFGERRCAGWFRIDERDLIGPSHRIPNLIIGEREL